MKTEGGADHSVPIVKSFEIGRSKEREQRHLDVRLRQRRDELGDAKTRSSGLDGKGSEGDCPDLDGPAASADICRSLSRREEQEPGEDDSGPRIGCFGRLG